MPAKVYKYDLYGPRKAKFEFLENATLANIDWTELPDNTDKWLLESDQKGEYDLGFGVNQLFKVNSVGILTARDATTIQNSKEDVEMIVDDFLDLDSESLRHKYSLGADVRDWKVDLAKEDVKKYYAIDRIVPISYRPFDTRYTFYTGKSKGFHCMPRGEVMQHIIGYKNLGLVFEKIVPSKHNYSDIFITTNIIDAHNIGSASYLSPLYLHTPDGQKVPNLDRVIVKKIEAGLGLGLDWEIPLLRGASEGGGVDPLMESEGLGHLRDGDAEVASTGIFTPVDLLDYIYGVLHSPTYREKYKELLKSDFPRVPYPDNQDKFWSLAGFGSKLRKLHLLEDAICEDFVTTFPVGGSDEVEKVSFKESTPSASRPPLNEGNLTKSASDDLNKGNFGEVWINETQYFGNVPEIAWNFYIGGYQPAQKYLKDRKGKVLTSDEIEQWQRIVRVLLETSRIMGEIG